MSLKTLKNTIPTSANEYTAMQCCPVCGHRHFSEAPVLWPELISTWELNPAEERFINRQQGYHCNHCHANLRSMTLAAAVNEFFDWRDTLTSLASHPAASAVHLLEINEAGSLHPILARFPNAVFGAYPDIDMQALSYPDNTFDLVIHSDTLEHVPDPIQGLRECLRIIKPGGCMLLTIPILPTRLTRRRTHLPPSYHGNNLGDAKDMLVHSEYGADFFLDFISAGWHQTTLFTLTGPEAMTIVGTKSIATQGGQHGRS